MKYRDRSLLYKVRNQNLDHVYQPAALANLCNHQSWVQYKY